MIDLISFINSIDAFSLLFWIMLGTYLWYTFSIIYHLIRFSVGQTPKIAALVFFTGSFLLFTASLNAYYQINWKTIIEGISNLINF